MKTSSQPSPEGTLLVVSGPSGVGKSSVIEGVRARTGAHFSVSATTRAPRRGEIDGREYRFVDEERFAELVRSGGMLEWAEYGGEKYGTPAEPVLQRLLAGDHVILDIENEGAHQVKRAYPRAVLVFIMPPSDGELERRLTGRGDTDEADIARRLSVASDQMRDARQHYDHLVVNENLEAAISRVVSILRPPAVSDADSSAPQGAGPPASTRSDPAC